MKTITVLGLLIGLSLGACKHDENPPATANLAGNWGGTYETQQAGSCTWSGDASIPATASWQVSGTSVTGTLSRQYGQTTTPVSLTGTLNGTAVQLNELKANNVTCNGVSRTYSARYQGSIAGNTLNLVSMDTLCPVQGCIFRRTLKLTRQ